MAIQLTIPVGYSLFEEDLENVRRLAAPFFQKLGGSHIFLTGCTGFMGKWLMECLLWANERDGLDISLTALSRDPKGFLSRMPHLADKTALRFISGDVAGFSAKGLRPFSHAVHGANLANDNSQSWPMRHCASAAEGTGHFFRMAKDMECAAVLLLSSGAVYGMGPAVESPFQESTPAVSLALSEPEVYRETKRFVEMYATACGRSLGIRVVPARCFAFMGAHIPVNAQNALGGFIADALAGRDINIRGDGTPVRTFLYATDMVVWLLGLLVLGEHGEPYNVGAEQQISIRQLALDVLAAAKSPATVHVAGKALRGNAPQSYVPDTSRCRNLLQVAEHTSFAEGLHKTIQWHRIAGRV